MARGSLVTPVWRPNTKVASVTASASAKAASGSPAVSVRWERLVLDLDQRASVFRFGARSCHHRANRFALPAGAGDRDGMLRRRFDAFQMREHADPRRDHVRKLGAGNDGDHAGRFLGLFGRDVFDARMCVRRAHEGDVRHARQHDVADILPAPLRQSRQIRPRHRAADIGVRPVERTQARGHVAADLHALPPARARATASTASTIA
jgi:hypothetical protein